MAKVKGFIEYKRKDIGHRPVENRIHDFNEIALPLSPDDLVKQAARCIDCGIPFCHGAGCPVFNRIPEFNDLIYQNRWKQACDNLHSTNNFPEFTGRVCPAPCEAACTLAINDDAVNIKHIELQIVERGFEEGWIKPIISPMKTGKRVAVIGSGPAGLAAAQQLARYGHDVTVFEKSEKPGGLLRYGIPDFKLDKKIIERRLEQMKAEGVVFQGGVEVGIDISIRYLKKMFDSICLTMGAGQPRDIQVSGRYLEGTFFAMDFLTQQNQIVSDESIEADAEIISAKDKDVIVIGGGDTGSDCVGTSIRQGAKSITQVEILPQPPIETPDDTPWPNWPRIMRTSTSHEEGCKRMWSVMTKQIEGTWGKIQKISCVKVDWVKYKGKWKLKEIPGTEFELKADLILLAMGFVHVVHEGLVKELDLELDNNGNIVVNDYQTSKPWVYAAGDSVSGASLVVRAINAGRQAAEAINRNLSS